MFAFGTGVSRPNRLKDKKDKSYHTRYAKYCLGTMSNTTYQSFINKSLLNWAFYKGKQWVLEDDLEAFFLDESGDMRNRLKWTKNIIRPMVNQYVGNAIRLSYEAKAECVSDFVINKREQDLTTLKNLHKVSELFPFFKEMITDRYPIGETELETEEIFNNTFVEEYSTTINNLLQFVSEDINMNELKVQLTRSLAVTGLGVYKGYESGDLYRGDCINSLYYFWDVSAMKPDLSDSSFMGEWYFLDASTILERYQEITKEEAEAIENYSQSNVSSFQRMINNVLSEQGDKIPVYEVYWKDVEEIEYGWVLDEFGYPYFTKINCKDSEYTDKDLIEPPTEKQKEKLGKSNKSKIYVDVLRYCIMIPQEEVGGGCGDIVLEHGILPYQEKNYYDPANVKFPYKCYTWAYDRGEVISPIDDTIDPQRFLNRILSVAEAHFSNMRGSGTAISKDAIDDNEAETLRNINASKPIFVDTRRTGSVQNSISQYGTNIGSDTYNMFQAVKEIQMSIQDVTGVNEAMTGTQGGGSDVLVGVIEAQIQRGSLVQEPFYWALTSILNQAYEHIATVGKSIYLDNPRKLSIIVGDKGLQNIVLTKEHQMQDYRVFINRSETKEQGIQAGNALLMTLLQAGLIDDKVFSNLFNRSNPDMIAKALREFARLKQQAQNQAEKQQFQLSQQQQQAQMDQAMQQQQMLQQASDVEQVNEGLKHEREMEKIALKGSLGGR